MNNTSFDLILKLTKSEDIILLRKKGLLGTGWKKRTHYFIFKLLICSSEKSELH